MELIDSISNLTEAELNEALILQASIEAEDAMSDVERRQTNERLALQADLAEFCRASWPTLEPGVDMDWSWHYDLICEYLTMVYERKIRRLIINISPRTAKSLIVSVIFPAWVWAKQNTHSFACASYSAPLSTEHSVKRRSLIESEWYQARWGSTVHMAKDQNEKNKFKNTAMAQMIATSVGGTATGLGGDTLILDDGMNPKQVASDAETLATHNWFDNTWRTRLNDLATGAFIIIEQRTGERDVTGHCLEADDILQKEGKPREWTHLSIPLVCENQPERYSYPISGKVKIREVGDVLQPKRFPAAVVASLQVRRLVYATQYQQQPSPLEGNMIKRADIRYYGGRDPVTGELDPPLPAKFDMHLVSADCAFKDLETSDMVAVGTIAVKGPDRYVRDIVNKHLDLPATETEILRQQQACKASVVLVEDKANGSAVIKSVKRKISGVVAINPEGGKVNRVFATAGEFQAGNWWFDRNAAYTEVAIEQLTKFPGAKYDDICFAAGTKVATPTGNKNIEDVRVGDRVITPFGLQSVTAAGITGYCETMEWRGLHLTPNHKVFADGEFSRVDSIAQSAIDDRMGACSLIRWMLLKQLSFLASPTDSWVGRGAITSANRLATQAGSALRACTLLFGDMSTVRRYQKATTFITRTLIGSTTILAIWCAYAIGNILRCILHRMQLPKPWRTLASSRLYGTVLKKGALGTERYLVDPSRGANEYAFNARSHSWRERLAVIAQTIVGGKHGPLLAGATSLSYAEYAQRCSPRFVASIPIATTEPAAKSVAAKLSDPSPVYDLTVDSGCFYANGILVSNCDLITQAAIYLQRNTYVYGLTEYVQRQEAEMKRKQNRNKPANETPVEAATAIAKMDNPSTLTKPDIDDKTERCPECSSTFIQRVPGGNKRCGQCGHMMMRTGVLTSNSVSPGQLRK